MGNNQTLVSPSSYGRSIECIEYLQQEFWLTKSDLQQFYSLYSEIHKMNPKYEHLISVTEFMIHFHIESNSIHKLVFGWLSKSSPLAFSFIEFVAILCTFLSLNDNEFGKFIFVLFDNNGDGFLEYDEITSLVNLLKREDNVKLRPFMNIISELTNSERISYTLSSFLTFFHKHTALTNPFRQLKCELQHACLGSHYWEQKLIERLNPNKKKSKFANLEQYPVIAHEIREILYLIEKESNDEKMTRYHPNPNYISWGGAGNEERKETRQTFPMATSSSSSSGGTAAGGAGAGGASSPTKPGTKRREYRRGTSNDDMLDTTGKLHTQPSGRRLQQQKTQKQLQQVGAIMEVYHSTSSSSAAAGGERGGERGERGGDRGERGERGSVNFPRIRQYEEEEEVDNDELPQIKGKNSIDKSSSAESHPLTISTGASSKFPKQSSSANLLPAVSRRSGGSGTAAGGGGGGSLNSPHGPLSRNPSGARIIQPLVQPKGVVAATAARKLLRKYSSDDMLR